jgi:hypothetical protein
VPVTPANLPLPPKPTCRYLTWRSFRSKNRYTLWRRWGDDTDEYVTRAAIADYDVLRAHLRVFAGSRHGTERTTLDCCRYNRTASSRDGIKLENALAGDLSAEYPQESN